MLLFCSNSGTSVIQVTATDADDSNYGNSAKVVYSILQGQPYFSVDPDTGQKVSLFCSNHIGFFSFQLCLALTPFQFYPSPKQKVLTLYVSTPKIEAFINLFK